MGEESKKPVGEKKMEEKKPEGEESGKKPEEKPPEKSGDPKEEEEKEKKPQEIVLKIYMHCEGCAKKVRRCLKSFEGVEDVTTDCKSGKVIVKGDKADPLKVLERLQRKSNRQVELLSPVPEPRPAEEPEKKVAEDDKPKAEEKKEEVVTVVLRVHMHCEACAMEIQKRIMRMKGVESVEPDYKASQVSVKGIFAPAKLVEYIHRKSGKHAVVLKQDPPPPPKSPEKDKDKPSKGDSKKGKAEEKKPKEEKNKQDHQDKGAKETKDPGAGEAKPEAESGGAVAAAEERGAETKRSEYYYHYSPPRYPMESVYYAQPPQIFSDENPNACTVM